MAEQHGDWLETLLLWVPVKIAALFAAAWAARKMLPPLWRGLKGLVAFEGFPDTLAGFERRQGEKIDRLESSLGAHREEANSAVVRIHERLDEIRDKVGKNSERLSILETKFSGSDCGREFDKRKSDKEGLLRWST